MAQVATTQSVLLDRELLLTTAIDCGFLVHETPARAIYKLEQIRESVSLAWDNTLTLAPKEQADNKPYAYVDQFISIILIKRRGCGFKEMKTHNYNDAANQ
ncbi:MAG TPA: hypothetical protein VN920_04615 [Pyrinomonadaceae bacterium]|nr:hypothetical protein [Pyrinomonadaceae bacterium]